MRRRDTLSTVGHKIRKKQDNKKEKDAFGNIIGDVVKDALILYLVKSWSLGC